MCAAGNCSNASGRVDENSWRSRTRARSSTSLPTRVGKCTEGRWLRIEKPLTGASAKLAQYVAMLLPVSTHVQCMGLLPTSDLNILSRNIVRGEFKAKGGIHTVTHTCASGQWTARRESRRVS